MQVAALQNLAAHAPGLGQGLARVRGGQLQAARLALQAGQGQQIADHAREVGAVLENDLAETAAFRRGVQADEGFRIALNGRERGAQFVRDIGHEVAAHALQAHQFRDVVEHGHGPQVAVRPGGPRQADRHDLAGRQGEVQMALHPAVFVARPAAGAGTGRVMGYALRRGRRRGRGQHLVHGLLQFRRGDDLHHLRAPGRGRGRKFPGKSAVAAADVPVRPQYQHAVAHGVQNAFQLGGLVRGGAHVLLDIFGHAVDRVGQGREFTARNAPQAALEIA